MIADPLSRQHAAASSVDRAESWLTQESADRLIATIREYGSAAVAFSGGVDSTVVAKAAALALGDRAVAVTASSASVAAGEVEAARELAKLIGIRHIVIETSEFDSPAYQANDGSRCFHCKSELYDRVAMLREKLAFEVICSGANLDDLGDYRPGLAAAAERGVRHPLQEAGFGKKEIREVAKFWKLPNADKPAMPCLSSRVAIGLQVTPERVARIDAAEQILRQNGFAIVRVRYHDNDHARIEVPEPDLPKLLDPQLRPAIVARFKDLGFKFVSVDLEGFRSGSLNVLVPAELLARRIEV